MNIISKWYLLVLLMLFYKEDRKQFFHLTFDMKKHTSGVWENRGMTQGTN